jgi:hypothetical protein
MPKSSSFTTPVVEGLTLLREARQHARQRHAVQVLHHDERHRTGVGQPVNPAHVGMDQLRGQVGLVAEHGDEVFVVSEVGQDALDHHHVVDRERAGARLARQEDLGHAARGQLGQQLVVAEGCIAHGSSPGGGHRVTPRVVGG